jgi:hypothetical protein
MVYMCGHNSNVLRTMTVAFSHTKLAYGRFHACATEQGAAGTKDCGWPLQIDTLIRHRFSIHTKILFTPVTADGRCCCCCLAFALKYHYSRGFSSRVVEGFRVNYCPSTTNYQIYPPTHTHMCRIPLDYKPVANKLQQYICQK